MVYKRLYNIDDLVNVTEEIVCEELFNLIQAGEIDICQCEICLLDIVALTLNKMPPEYWGNRFERERHRHALNVEKVAKLRDLAYKTLKKSVIQVANKPHH